MVLYLYLVRDGESQRIRGRRRARRRTVAGWMALHRARPSRRGSEGER
jgi:hypothetical protein